MTEFRGIPIDALDSRQHGAPDWLPTPGAADRVREDWRAVRPLVHWLDALDRDVLAELVRRAWETDHEHSC